MNEKRQEPVTESGMRLAGLEDIAAMKVTAAIGHGTKKDFIDIATLLDFFSLQQILILSREVSKFLSFHGN